MEYFTSDSSVTAIDVKQLFGYSASFVIVKSGIDCQGQLHILEAPLRFNSWSNELQQAYQIPHHRRWQPSQLYFLPKTWHSP